MDRTRLARWATGLLGGWIFAGGTATLVLTLAVCRLYHADEFDGNVPTISSAASMQPEQRLFTAGTLSVGICIMIGWCVAYLYNRGHIRRAGPASSHWFNLLALLLGLLEGASVAGLGQFRMDNALDLHMLASYSTFFSGAFAFLVDSLGTARWQPPEGERPSPFRRARLILALFVTGVGTFFFVMFLTKDGEPFGDHLTTRIVYVGAEIALASLSFLYAPLYGAELARRLRVDSGPARERVAA